MNKAPSGKIGAVQADQTTTDPGLLNVLQKMMSWSDSSAHGVQYKLRINTLDTFFGDHSLVQGRLMRIAADDSVGADERSLASKLLRNLDDDIR